MSDEIRVAIVEDSPAYRAGLEEFFRHASGYVLAASFDSADGLLREARRLSGSGSAPAWDLVLMDLELPGTDGIEATRGLKELFPGLAVVVLTVFEEPSTIVEAISAGADGYMLKKSSTRELLAQLGAIATGGAPLTAAVARKILDLLRSAPRAGVAAGGRAPARLDLTEREQDVLRCLVRGFSYQRTADELGVGLDTVRTHVKATYRKLQVHSVAEAVSRAVREGLV